jgi:hypothetical protein
MYYFVLLLVIIPLAYDKLNVGLDCRVRLKF